MLTLRKFIYDFCKDNAPEANCDPGTIVHFVTQDCFGGQIKTEADHEENIDFTHTNPATGPLYVNGAEPGDVLAVDILDIQTASHGVIATIEGFGALWKTCELRTKIVQVRDGVVYFNDVTWPADPMIGVIGTAPAKDPVPSGYSFCCGGNMDSRKIRKGATVYFPVQVEGALLAMGDVHASMGDGEVCETGIEIAADIVVRVRLIKQFHLNWPVTETADAWYVNTNGRTCDTAIQRGYEELQRLVMNAYGWDATDTTMYISVQGILEANQAVLDQNETDEEGDTFRVGVPKLAGKPRLIP
ncbi:acetamidase/formamidase family protein [Galactobacillus timonensis]|uniref:acetamidase/formamidase family protein n=1 Tax=Galactobacillus timonensis TaxID=2041840 RepID=UPI000C84E377|nr:acetamidase/formamidase family protein [Galactobacillus timonensis]